MNTEDKYDEILSQYPEYISKEQMYKICHISKRKAAYLLQNGYIPCENNRKLTRNYRVKTTDVVKYLRECETSPEKSLAISGLFGRKKHIVVSSLSYSDEYIECMRNFYDELFMRYPDVVRLNEASEMIGYSPDTIKHWINNKAIKAFKRNGTFFIPKITLIDYLISMEYRKKIDKSDKQKSDMRTFHYKVLPNKKEGVKNMCKILTIANQKGGVGKSTTVLNLGYALGRAGKRVLLIELDPQGSLTVCFGVKNHEKLKTTVYHLMNNVLEGEPLPPKNEYMINKGNVDLIPCNIGLFAIEDKLKDEVGSEQTVSYIIAELKEDYDYVLIDTSPSLGFLTLNALTASDGVIITVSPQFLSAVGISLLLKTIEKIKRRVNQRLQIEGVLMTMCDSRTNLHRDIYDVIEHSYKNSINIFATQIPNSIKVGEANFNRLSVIEYEPKNKASIAYTELAEEVASRG